MSVQFKISFPLIIKKKIELLRKKLLQFESKNCDEKIDRRMIHWSCMLHPFIQTIRHSICVLPPVYTNVAYYLPRRKNTPLSSARQTRKSLYLRRIFLFFSFFSFFLQRGRCGCLHRFIVVARENTLRFLSSLSARPFKSFFFLFFHFVLTRF